jgi:hypothetical protein
MPSVWIISLLAFALTLPGLSSGQNRVEVRDGEKGYIHVVVKGDTLWDVSNSYLGTPWIWPSVWNENDEIQNPHLIYPTEEIWISERLMRKLTPEEAERLRQLMAEKTAAAAESAAGADGTPPVYGSDGLLLELPAAPSGDQESAPSGDDPFAALDQGETGVRRVMRFAGLHRYGFITDLEYAGTGAIMGSHDANYWTSQGQRTIVSIGEGHAHMGDPLTVFRTIRRVIHPETLEILGYFVQILGRAEVTEIHPEASYVKLVASYAEIQPGDRVMPYVEQPTEFVEVHSEESLEGRVLAYQPFRLRSSSGDLVILDRGTREGMTPGRNFEIFRMGRVARDPATLEKVRVPDDVVGGAFVVKVSEKTSLALLMRAKTEILVGDCFRSHR